LWATVPGEATVVDLNMDGSPDASSERLVPARDVAVGTNVYVKSGQQVRFCTGTVWEISLKKARS